MIWTAAEPPAAVVLDCDGLLLETESAWTVAEAAVVESFGFEFTPELKRRLLGTSAVRSAALLAEHVGVGPEEGPNLADAVHEGFERELRRSGARPMPGAAELVTALAERGVPLAVASNTMAALVGLALSGSGLPDVFGAVVCAGNGLRPKPEPDVYLAACEALGVPPARALAFEDSQVGVEAARAAGLRVVGVPSLPGQHLDADAVLASLADVDAAALAP